jgi:hypothetical protein
VNFFFFCLQTFFLPFVSHSVPLALSPRLTYFRLVAYFLSCVRRGTTATTQHLFACHRHLLVYTVQLDQSLFWVASSLEYWTLLFCTSARTRPSVACNFIHVCVCARTVLTRSLAKTSLFLVRSSPTSFISYYYYYYYYYYCCRWRLYVRVCVCVCGLDADRSGEYNWVRNVRRLVLCEAITQDLYTHTHTHTHTHTQSVRTLCYTYSIRIEEARAFVVSGTFRTGLLLRTLGWHDNIASPERFINLIRRNTYNPWLSYLSAVRRDLSPSRRSETAVRDVCSERFFDSIICPRRARYNDDRESIKTTVIR